MIDDIFRAQQQQAGCSTDGRHIQAELGKAHHRTTEDNFARFFEQATTDFHQVRERSADANPEIFRLPNRRARHRADPFNQRSPMHYGIGDRCRR